MHTRLRNKFISDNLMFTAAVKYSKSSKRSKLLNSLGAHTHVSPHINRTLYLYYPSIFSYYISEIRRSRTRLVHTNICFQFRAMIAPTHVRLPGRVNSKWINANTHVLFSLSLWVHLSICLGLNVCRKVRFSGLSTCLGSCPCELLGASS